MTGISGNKLRLLGIVASLLLLAASTASAQSAINGIVRDTSGAVLPGVTVEASSDVLIEKVRTVTTDNEGRYSIVDLRPGTYVVVFTLGGFSTLRREGVQLPANFTSTINADMKVGALEESVTVTGASPIVDVSNTQRTQVLTRDLLDSLPTGRNYSGLAALMPGVKMSNTDVGGNQQMEQIYMRVHGSRQTDTTVQVDGMQLNSLMNDGQVQAYYSDAANAEVSYSTSGGGADVSGGGLKINMIPKEGGNRTSGQLFAGGIKESWQGDNTKSLRSRGVQSGDTVHLVTDFNFAIGGPIKQDRLWYFTTTRRISTDEVVAQNFYRDGRPGIEDQWIYNLMGRVTVQATPKIKVTSYFDRYPKQKNHEMGAFTDPDTAARRREWQHALYYTTQSKVTSTLTSRLLLEGGYSSNVEYYTGRYQPGIEKTRGTPEWYSQTGHEELVAYGPGTNSPYRYWNGINTPSNGTDPRKHVLSAVASYVTGTHAVKSGVQWGFGPYITRGDLNGDLIQLYRSGIADQVRVYNTPRQAKEFLNADLGIFAQDSWRIERLTINYGIRLEYFNGEITAQSAPAGRFVPARTYPEQKCMPCWFDVTPRLGLAYDLFGNARTALKASVNKYMAGQTLGFAQRYNPFSSLSDTRTWTDTNKDDIAQDSEIGASTVANFGTAVPTRHPDPNIGREYDWEYSAGLQHELVPGVSVSASWYHRETYNMTKSVNAGFTPADYTVVNVVSPLDGTVIPAYNRDPNKRLIDRVDVNSTDRDLRSFSYNGFEFGAAARIKRATLFGGWTVDRTLLNHCDELENWGNLSAVYYDASGQNSQAPKSDYQYCNQSALGLPYLSEFKLSGSYQLPWQIQINAAFQSYPGPVLPTRWNIGRTTRYAADCKGPCTPGALVIPNMTPSQYVLDLTPPGSDYYDRLNQLDLGFRKIFKIGRYQYSGQMDLFNATNSSYIKAQSTTFGATLGQVSSTLQPITMRLAVQMRF